MKLKKRLLEEKATYKDPSEIKASLSRDFYQTR